MAASVDITSAYPGEVAGALLRLMVLGNEAIEKGSVYLETDVKKALYIDRLRVTANSIQARVEDPTVPAEAIVYDERLLTPLDMMFFDLINPRYFENVWRRYHPEGPMVDRVDNPVIQAAIIEEVAKMIGSQLGRLTWQGDTAGAADLAFFDGFEKIILGAANSVKVTPAGAVTVGNIIATLEACEGAVPDPMYSDPNMTFHMSTTNFRLYGQAARALDYKGPDIGGATSGQFAGRAIRHYSGMSDANIIVAKGTADRDSNLWAGVDFPDDHENVKIARYRPESERFIVKALFKMGVQIGNAEECVIYNDGL